MEVFIFAFAYIFVGLIGIGLVVASRFHILMLYYSFFSVMIGIWTLSVSPHRGLVYAGPWRNIELVSFYLMPLGLALYFDRLFWGGWRNIFRRIWQYYILLFVLSFIYTLPWAHTLETILPVFQVSLIAAILLWMGIILSDIRRHRENLAVVLGGSIMGVTGIIDLFHALRILDGQSSLVHYGIFAFFIALSGHLILSIFEVAERESLLSGIGAETPASAGSFFRALIRRRSSG